MKPTGNFLTFSQVDSKVFSNVATPEIPLILGKNHIDDPNQVLIIGGGASSSNKKNIFALSKDGDITISGNSIFGGNWKDTPTQLGCLAFRMASKIETIGNDYRVVLTDDPAVVEYDKLNSTTYNQVFDPSSTILSDYKVNDILSMINSNKCYNAIKVVSITGNGLTYSVISDNQRASSVKSLKDVGTSDFDDYTVFCLTNPTVGVVQIAPNAFSIGAGNKVQGYFGAAFGRQNQTFGNYGFTSGRENQAGYTAMAIGNGNKALGDNSIALGRKNTLTFPGHAFGTENTVTAENATAIGIGNTVSTQGAVAIGRYNQDVSDAIFMVGCGSSKSSPKNVLFLDTAGNLTIGKAFTTNGSITIKDNSGNLKGQINGIDNSITKTSNNYTVPSTLAVYNTIQTLLNRIAALEAKVK